MRRFAVLLFVILIAGSLSGCVYTRLTEMTWEAGRLHYYADFSRILENCVYELDGRYYMTVCISSYSDSPEFLGLLAPAVSFRNSSLNTENFRPKPPFTSVQITPELAKYLTDAGGNGKIPYISDHVIGHGVGVDFKKQGRKIPVIKKLPAPEIVPAPGIADSVSDSVPLYSQRTFAGACAQLALPVSFCLDVAMTPVVNVLTYLYALPGAALTACGAKLMAQDGVELGDTEMVFNYDDDDTKGKENMDEKIVPAGEYKPIPLYSVTNFDEMKKEERAKNVSIQYFVPENRTGAAVIVCPGGGYGGLCDSYEGYEVARWLNKFGITAIVLRYRVGYNLDLLPLTDSLTAVRYVRENAAQYGIDPDRIGIIGFSAGGHLASATATHGKGESAVNFHILIYPVISLSDKWTHKGSQQNFLGKLISEETKTKYSSDLQVTAETSPAFVCHAATDQLVPVENSRMYVDAMKKHKVPVTYLELPQGAHGLGCGSGPHWKAWLDACGEWLLKNKLGTK